MRGHHDLAQYARAGCGYLHRDLVGLDLQQRFVFGNVVTDRLKPREHLRTGALGVITRQQHLYNVTHSSITRDATDSLDYRTYRGQHRVH